MIEALQAQAMPLVRAGGVFLAILGFALVLGALRMQWRQFLLWAGFAAGAVALALTAVPLGAPYGRPSALQLWSLAIAVAFEVAAIVIFVPRAARHGQRAIVLATLAIVGAHLIIMTPAFGPIVTALGGACLVNAVAGARVAAYPARAVWGVDGLLKLGFGLAMFLMR